MKTSQGSVVTWVWLLLLLITLGSWGISTPAWGMPGGNGMTLLGILLLTVFKMRLVLSHFMQVRHAPRAIGYLCSFWLVLLFGLLLWIYH